MILLIGKIESHHEINPKSPVFWSLYSVKSCTKKDEVELPDAVDLQNAKEAQLKLTWMDSKSCFPGFKWTKCN